MANEASPTRFEVTRQLPSGETITLVGEEAGEGPALVLLHGLSASRRYVVQGSRYLARNGYRLIAYDARGHGESSPPPDPSAYEYEDLVDDLDAVIAHFGIERPVLIGSSMGAATAIAWALKNPNRVPALVLVTPAFADRERELAPNERWEELASGLEEGGIDGFLDAAEDPDLPEEWREAAREANRQRIEKHTHLDAVAQALRVTPESRAFDGLGAVEGLDVPTLVVASRDEPDPLHPFAIAKEYVRRLPDAELVVEDEGKSPVAWQGAQLSRAIEDFLDRKLAVED